MRTWLHPRRFSPGSVVSTVAVGLAATTILASACASRTPSAAGTPSPNGTVVQVTAANAGKVVTLHVGDTLRILLGPPMGHGFLNWELRAYPKDALTLLATGQQRDQFDLLAVAAGKGTVSLVGMVRCEGGPMAAEGVHCPVLGAGGSAGGAHPSAGSTSPGAPGAMPARLVTFEVTVTA